MCEKIDKKEKLLFSRSQFLEQLFISKQRKQRRRGSKGERNKDEKETQRSERRELEREC